MLDTAHCGDRSVRRKDDHGWAGSTSLVRRPCVTATAGADRRDERRRRRSSGRIGFSRWTHRRRDRRRLRYRDCQDRHRSHRRHQRHVSRHFGTYGAVLGAVLLATNAARRKPRTVIGWLFGGAILGGGVGGLGSLALVRAIVQPVLNSGRDPETAF